MKTKRFITICICSIAVIAGGLAWQRARAPQRAEYLLINQTANHDYDLAFRMSLKLAEKKTGIENALVLLPSLPPSKSIEQTAGELFAQFRIGARRNGRGILYLYSARENLMRIEVAYALEGDIPDAFCRRLEDAAKTYMLSEVPQDFISELIITTNLRGMGSPTDATSLAPPQWLNQAFLAGGAGAHAPGYRRTLDDYRRAILQLPDAGTARYSASKDAAETLRRYLDSLAAGIGDPRLPLLTEGSRIFRAVVPRNAEQQQRIHAFFTAAGADTLIFSGDLALAVPGPDKSNLPIVLRRAAGGWWFVDEAKSWTWFHRFEDNVNFFVKYADNPFFAALQMKRLPNMGRAIYGSHVTTPALHAYPYSIATAVKNIEEKIRTAPDNAANYAELGDLYIFEMNWITPAIAFFEKAAALAPDRLEYHWRLMDLYLNASRADKMLDELGFLAAHLPGDKQTQDWYQAYKKNYDFAGH